MFTGIVRRIDDLGRIVIPKEIRRMLNIKEGDSLEFVTDKFDKDRPMLCLIKYTDDQGCNIFQNLITRLEGIKRDLYYETEKETAVKITNLISFLNKNKDKFDF